MFIIAILQHTIESELKTAFQKARLGLATDEELIKEISAKFSNNIKETQFSVLTTVLMYLYDFDYDKISADIAKVLLLDTSGVVLVKDRFKVLSAIFPAINFYCKGDYSKILNFIESMKYDGCDDEDYDNLPFQ